MLTRSDPATSIDIITECLVARRSIRASSRNARRKGDFTNSRAIIDACRPFHWRDKFPKVNMPSLEAAPPRAAAVRLSAEIAQMEPTGTASGGPDDGCAIRG